MLGVREAFDLAVRNVARWGDTDVFPFAPENHILHDRKDEVVDLLEQMDSDLDNAIISNPPYVDGALALITYEGFRYVSQIDPIWNAYFLGLILRSAPEIEEARVPRNADTVYSYRIEIDDAKSSIFSEGGWNQYTDASEEIARSRDHIAICDIADFYGRVYHHRIENSLALLSTNDVPRKVDKLLRSFSGGPSYGLPVGGPAARILSELLLNRVDRMLRDAGIRFCRYSDDYRLFADTREEAFRSLVFLTERLLRHEGLALQRHKTRVLATKDFLRSPLVLPEDTDELSSHERQERRLLRLSLRFDPYSSTAEEDYERLKETVEQFDIIGMLTTEVAKSRINTAVVKRLAQIIRLFDDDIRDAATEMLVSNLHVLAPALPVVLRVIEEVLPDVSPELKRRVPQEIRRRITSEEYWVMVPVNLAYALRILQHDNSEENLTLCTMLFDKVPPFIQRDIVYLMHNWQADHWISDKRRQWMTQHPWVKRAVLLGSFALGDEGRHWRREVRPRLSDFDKIADEWMQERVQSNRRELPL